MPWHPFIRRHCLTLSALVLLVGLASAHVAQAKAAQALAAPAGLIIGTADKAPRSVLEQGAALAPDVHLIRGDAATAQRLRKRPGVRYVEPNRAIRAATVPAVSVQTATPQRALDAIDVLPAWNVPAKISVTVAVLDTGIDATHPDLAAALWHNPRPTVGDVNGYNVFTHTGDVLDGSGHGTAVAGIVGARPATTLGVSGVAPRARLMAVKVLDRNAVGTTASVVAGMRYALRHGARVINLSLAGPERSPALEEQMRAAQQAGVLVVTAAGNDGADVGSAPRYPGSYRQRNIIGVASTDATGALSSFSNHGGSLALAAPGEDILTTAPNSGYTHFYGTSAAAPEVAGGAALLEAARPDATTAQVRAALEYGAQRLPALTGKVRAGQLDVSAAMSRLRAEPMPSCHGTPARLHVRVVRRPRGDPVLRWSHAGAGACGVRLVLTGGQRPRQRRVFGSARRRWTVHRPPGRYRWRMVGLDARGQSGAARSGHLRVSRRGPRTHG